MTHFETKDSGERQQFDSGMQRDTEAGKARFDLMLPKGVAYEDQLLTRFAMLLSRGAEKYDARNWEQADSEAEVERARSSAFRHFMQWMTGETDEDHAAAVIFNIMVVETISKRIAEPESESEDDEDYLAQQRVRDYDIRFKPPTPFVDMSTDELAAQVGEMFDRHQIGWYVGRAPIPEPDLPHVDTGNPTVEEALESKDRFADFDLPDLSPMQTAINESIRKLVNVMPHFTLNEDGSVTATTGDFRPDCNDRCYGEPCIHETEISTEDLRFDG